MAGVRILNRYIGEPNLEKRYGFEHRFSLFLLNPMKNWVTKKNLFLDTHVGRHVFNIRLLIDNLIIIKPLRKSGNYLFFAILRYSIDLPGRHFH